MNFREICDLFGGQCETARILGKKSARHIRRVVAGSAPLPDSWIPELKSKALTQALKITKEAQKRSDALFEWSDNVGK